MRPRRYPSDTSAAEWALLEQLLPVPACQTPTGGRPEKHDRRDVVDAIRHLVANGCTWRAIPADFPPWATVYNFFARWARQGVVNQIQDQLRRAIRLRKGPLSWGGHPHRRFSIGEGIGNGQQGHSRL